MEESITPLSREGISSCPTAVIDGGITPLARDWWTDGSGEYKGNGGSQGKVHSQTCSDKPPNLPPCPRDANDVEFVARRRKKKRKLVRQVNEPSTPTSDQTVQEKPTRTHRFKELFDVYKQDTWQVDMPVTEEWLEQHYGHLIPSSTPVYNSIEQLLEVVDNINQEPTPQTSMTSTLKDYEEEVVDEGPLKFDPSRKVGEWEEVDLDTMDTNLNSLLYQTCPFHPHLYIHCMNPQAEVGNLRYKCP